MGTFLAGLNFIGGCLFHYYFAAAVLVCAYCLYEIYTGGYFELCSYVVVGGTGNLFELFSGNVCDIDGNGLIV